MTRRDAIVDATTSWDLYMTGEQACLPELPTITAAGDEWWVPRG